MDQDLRKRTELFKLKYYGKDNILRDYCHSPVKCFQHRNTVKNAHKEKEHFINSICIHTELYVCVYTYMDGSRHIDQYL